MKISFFQGSDCTQELAVVADFRIQYFREYPYLYVGNKAYEQEYLRDLAANPLAVLLTVTDPATHAIVAIATGTPVAGDSPITKDIPQLLPEGARPETYYYFSETVITPACRGKNLGRELYARREAFAREQGFEHICLLTVTRPKDHPLRPATYQDPYAFWEKLGYHREPSAEIQFSWPTLQPDGSCREESHPMQLWVKSLD